MRSFCDPLYLAVTCHDYPQLWDPAASFAERRTQLVLAQAGEPPERFAPFTATTWTSLDYEGATACLRWPAPRVADPAVPPDAPYPDVPTLVLNGDLDNITASSGARVVASRFPRSTFVETANTIHISAISDRDDCAAPMVRCLSPRSTPATTLRLVAGRGPRCWYLPAARWRHARARRHAAAETVADATTRWQIHDSGRSRGPRGGRWSYTGTRLVRFRFRGARFVRDVPVTGSATWRIGTGAVRASVRVPAGRVRAAWNVRKQLARGELTGRLGGRELRADILAP